MSKLISIILETRRRGQTQWLLKSAMKNPNVVIMCATESQKKDLVVRYTRMLAEAPWYVKLWRRYFGTPWPKFLTASDQMKLRGMKAPVVFDNYTILNMTEIEQQSYVQ